MKNCLAILSAVLILLAGCTQPVVEMFGGVSGVVKDSQSGAVLSGAKVTLSPGGHSQLTGNDGTFSFEELDPTEYTISFLKDGYMDESQKVSVKAGMISSVQVSMTPVQPVIKVTPEILDFGGENTTLAFEILNVGKGTLYWDIAEDISWLTCSKLEGETTGQVSSVVVTVSRDGMDKGSYSESIVVTSNGGTAVVKVKMSVDAIKLSVEPGLLDFGTLETSLQVKLLNTGNGSIKYTASAENSWLTLSKTTGTVTDSDYLNVILSRAGLAAGKYNSSVTFYAEGGEISVPVKMEVPVLSAPAVVMESVSDITYDGVVLKGTVTSIGSSVITRHGFCYGKNSEPTVGDKIANLGDCKSPCSMTTTLSGLENSTKYYVRAFAENAEGTAYSSEILSFTTSALPVAPEVLTVMDVADVTSNSATAKGMLVSDGGGKISAYGHVWNTTGNPTLTNGSKTDLGAATSMSSFTSELKSLQSDTKYYVRAYAVNEMGTTYGDQTSFRTEKTPVQIVTAVNDYTYRSADLSASITAYNGHTVTEMGFCWNKTGVPSISDQHVVADDMFTASATGLDPETRYYVSAYVKTSEGKVFYGNDVVFTTNAAPANHTSGLYVYYNFEGNCKNSVDGGYDGVGINEPKFVEGMNGTKAIRFVTSDESYMNVPESMIDTYYYTLSFWVKGISDGHIFHVASSGSYGVSDGMLMKGGQLVYMQNGYSLMYHLAYDTGNDLSHVQFSADEWTHVVITVSIERYVSEIVCLYINGTLVDRQAIDNCTYNDIGNGTKFIFGGPYSKATGATMTVDNLRIYNTRALSDKEVRQIYEYER